MHDLYPPFPNHPCPTHPQSPTYCAVLRRAGPPLISFCPSSRCADSFALPADVSGGAATCDNEILSMRLVARPAKGRRPCSGRGRGSCPRITSQSLLCFKPEIPGPGRRCSDPPCHLHWCTLVTSSAARSAWAQPSHCLTRILTVPRRRRSERGCLAVDAGKTHAAG